MSLVGTKLERVDGPLKVSGHAEYAADVQLPNLAFGVLVCSTITTGRIASIDSSAATAHRGVLQVLTYQNCPKFHLPAKALPSQGQSLLPLQGPNISYCGEHVAVVIAQTFEVATAAARDLQIKYQADQAARRFAANVPALSAAKGTHDLRWGDTAKAIRKAAMRIEQSYSTPYEHHNPMELPSTTAAWNGDVLTLYDETQWLAGVRNLVSALLGLAADKVRVVSPFVGGSFGAKRVTWPHVYLAAVASKLTGRPVRLTLTRDQMYTTMGYRPRTAQKIVLAADRSGRLLALQHTATSTTSMFDDVVEPASARTGMMYACASGTFSRLLQKVDLGTPTTMRAPGESTGFFALETAIDELSYAAKTDPLKLRLMNHADADPTSQLPWSSKSLKQCYAEGAKQFGWAKRKAPPRSMRDGARLVGWGMASAAYPANRSPGSASVELFADGHCVVASATHEMGGGTYTALAAIAADTLGVALGSVTVQLGDSDLPATTVSGGSRTVNSVGPAVDAAAVQVIDKFIALAIADPASPLHGAEAGQVVAFGGNLMLKSKPRLLDPMSAVLTRNHLPSIKMTASTAPSSQAAKFSQYSFGAHFAEVHVDPDLGEVRVSRYVAAFAAGRIINLQAARSQLIGGIVGGIGMALLEESVVDPNVGTFINRNLVDYRIPVHADIPPIEVILIPEQDAVTSPLGTKGVGELGIVGAAAAIGNAVFHATGQRIRDLPITPERILAAELPARKARRR